MEKVKKAAQMAADEVERMGRPHAPDSTEWFEPVNVLARIADLLGQIGPGDILKEFLRLALENETKFTGCYRNTLVDIYLLAKRQGVDPKGLSTHERWVTFLKDFKG